MPTESSKVHTLVFLDGFYHVAKEKSNNSLKSVRSPRFGLIRNLGLILDDSFMY